jgi:hypothetical protein
MKKNSIRQWLYLILWLLVFSREALSHQVKVVRIPAGVEIEKNVTREVTVRNLAEEEIFSPTSFNIIDGFIYMRRDKPIGIIKLDLQGNIICQSGKRGQGPGELILFINICKYKENIAVLDKRNQKVVVFTKQLEFLKEFKLKAPFLYFSVDDKNRFLFHSSPGSAYYFEVYTEDGKFLNRFGNSMTTPSEYRKRMKFDSLRLSLPIAEEDGIWASFRDRYDLRYYKKMKLAAEIKNEKDFFKVDKQMIGGREIFMPADRALDLARMKNRFFYVYRKDKQIYCDIFDMKEYQLLRRIKFKRNYNQVVHYQDNIFYAMGYETDDESDLFLFKLEVLD